MNNYLDGNGLTRRELVCLLLRIPRTGQIDIDGLIREANGARDEDETREDAEDSKFVKAFEVARDELIKQAKENLDLKNNASELIDRAERAEAQFKNQLELSKKLAGEINHLESERSVWAPEAALTERDKWIYSLLRDQRILLDWLNLQKDSGLSSIQINDVIGKIKSA